MNRQLVSALQQAGRRAEAVESLQRYLSIHKAELGREPATALQDLYRSLTAGDTRVS
jgi:DNA-binding SARP family transcriptional activator